MKSHATTLAYPVPARTSIGDGTLGPRGDLGGATCQSLGLAAGALGCAASCAFDTSACMPGGVRAPVSAGHCGMKARAAFVRQ